MHFMRFRDSSRIERFKTKDFKLESMTQGASKIHGCLSASDYFKDMFILRCIQNKRALRAFDCKLSCYSITDGLLKIGCAPNKHQNGQRQNGSDHYLEVIKHPPPLCSMSTAEQLQCQSLRAVHETQWRNVNREHQNYLLTPGPKQKHWISFSQFIVAAKENEAIDFMVSG